MSKAKQFTARNGYNLRNRCGLKVTKITRKTIFAAEETIVAFSTGKKPWKQTMFLMELKELIKEIGYPTKQVFNFSETRLLLKMPNNIYIQRTVEQQPQHKMWIS